MTNFALEITIIAMQQAIIRSNHEKFDVIRNKINRRFVKFAFPSEIREMTKLNRANDKLLKAVDHKLAQLKSELNNKSTDPK